uniref:Uncharacterized protein n=1 Tax=Pristionchus pacificus TaxID=54126 RepID=A0A2A6CHF8_PRIPA|eukprot:PDM77508.1 hypothetical protein PRIPAC_34375 [Pristionchus pacificus]
MPSADETLVKKKKDCADPPFDKSFFTWSGMDKLSKVSVDRLSSFVFNREAYGSELCALFHKLVIYHQKWSAYNEEQKMQKASTDKPAEIRVVSTCKNDTSCSVTIAKRLAEEVEARKEDTLAKTLPDIKIEEDQSFSTPDHVQNDFVPTAAVFASPPPPDPSLGWPHMKKPKVEESSTDDDDKDFEKLLVSMESPHRIECNDRMQYQQSIGYSVEDGISAHVSMIFGERSGFSETIAQNPSHAVRRSSADNRLYNTNATSYPAVTLRHSTSPPPFMPAYSLHNQPTEGRVHHHSSSRPNYNRASVEEVEDRRISSASNGFDDIRCDHCVQRTNSCEKCYRTALLKREKAQIQAQLERNAQKAKRDNNSSPFRDTISRSQWPISILSIPIIAHFEGYKRRPHGLYSPFCRPSSLRMTVFAWLLLCVTVIQLGRSNSSISTDYGALSNSSSANSTLPPIYRSQIQRGNNSKNDEVLRNSSSANSTIPPIDRSQARRALRSVDSELADAQKAFDDAGSALNATKTEVRRAAAAKTDAEEALKKAYKETNETANALRDATRVFNEADQIVTEADVDQKKKDEDFKKASAAYEARMKTEFKDPQIQETYEDLEAKYGEATEFLKKTEGDWDDASKISSPFSKMLDDYNTLKVLKQGYEQDIATYNTNYQNDVAKKQAEEKIRKEKLQEQFNTAKATRDSAKTAQSIIDNNEIWNGKITGLDKMTIHQLVDDDGHTANKQAKELSVFDKKSTIKDIRKAFNEMLRDAEECTSNKILNEDSGEKYEKNGKKMTVAEVMTTKKSAVTKATAEHDIAVTAGTLATMRKSIDKAEEDYRCINELWTLNKDVTLEEFKTDFLNKKKPAAENMVKICENNDFLNGKIQDDFKTETIDQAVTRFRTIRDQAKEEHDKADPTKQNDLKPGLTKAENDLKFMKELATTFGKTMLVEGAKQKATTDKKDAETVMNKAKTNCILNGSLPIDQYAGRTIADVDIEVQMKNTRDDGDWKDKTAKLNAFVKANEELVFIQQLQTKFGGDKFVDDLKKAFKDKGAKEADAIINENKLNTILNIKDPAKTYTKLDDKLIAGALIEQAGIVASAEEEYKKGKNTPRKDVLDAAQKTAQAVQRFVLQLRKYDSLLIGDLKKNRATKESDDKAKARLPPLEQAVREAATALTNAIVADHAKREDLDAKEILLKKAKDSKAEADKKEREYQETMRILTGAFGGLGAIVFCAVAFGLVAFFLMKRRKKVQQQKKKSEKPEQPKYEEVDAPNGLTILRREGTCDKYVILGKDIPFNGPLIHRKPPKDRPVKHILEDQVGGEKIDGIFFDKNLNGAYAVGEGVEQWPEDDSVGIGDGREMLDGVDEPGKSNKGGEKIAKSNGPKTPTKNPPSSPNDEEGFDPIESHHPMNLGMDKLNKRLKIIQIPNEMVLCNSVLATELSLCNDM